MLAENDFVLTTGVMHGLTDEEQDEVVSLLDANLGPEIRSLDFGASIYSSGGADVHMVKSGLLRRIKSLLENALGREFSPLETQEIQEVEAVLEGLKPYGQRARDIFKDALSSK